MNTTCQSMFLSAAALTWTSMCLAADTPRPPVDQVIVVFKTHFDIGYTDLAVNVVQRYRTTMIDQALQVVDQNRDLPPEQQFAWTIPGWPMKKIAEDWAGQTPQRQARILQAFKDGRFVVHALPFTTHTELLEPEDLVRGLVFASGLARGAGLSLPRDAKMTDVPCHTWILPTLLRGAGVDFLHLGCNAASSSPEVPALFWWEGPNGSRLLTMYSAAGYGTGLVPPEGWPYRTWLALIHTGDNHGPPTPEEVGKLLKEAAEKLPGVKVRIGRLSDFADAILAEKADIPVVRGDMPDTWIYGPMCDPAGARLAKNTRPAIGTTEALGTLLRGWGIDPPGAADVVARAYEQSLLYGEHTWGGALYWVTAYGRGTKWGYGDAWKADHAAGRFQRLEESWAEHTGYIEKAHSLITPVLEGRMRTLAGAVKAEGQRVVVFNPLPWRRDGLAAIGPLSSGIPALKPVDGDDAAMIGRTAGGALFTARDVPPLGYRTYLPTKAEAAANDLKVDEQAGTFENRRLKIALDPARGAIRSIVDKQTGRELVDTTAERGFGQYLYERFDADQVAAFVRAYVKIDADWAVNELGKPSMPPAGQAPYRALSPKAVAVQFEQTPTFVAATLRADASGELNHGVSLRIILHADAPWLDLEMTVVNKPADPWPEAGWICLPFKVDSPQFRIGRPGSIIDPARDIVRGAGRHLFGVHTGVALFDADGRGAGLCPMDGPLVSLDVPGCWKYAPDFVPRRPTVYVNLFNNQWTTNFRLWNAGTWTSRVRVWPIERYAPEESLVAPSLEARYPVMACWVDGPGGELPPARAGLEVSGRGAMVTAFGPNPDGEGTLLRLWEMAGDGGPRRVRLGEGLRDVRIQACDLRGQPQGEPLRRAEGAWEAPMRAFAPSSFILTPP